VAPTAFIGAGHPSVRAFAERAVAGAVTERERVSRLFIAVRDEIRYDRAYLEYIRERGVYDDLPLRLILEVFAIAYPGFGTRDRTVDDPAFSA
jgi:hypothetical protein